MTRNAPAWLTERPIAHRGLHDAGAGRIENTLGAALAAVEAGYGFECDVQLSRDGVGVVFHDDTLDRLCDASGALIALSAAEIQRARFRQSRERIPTFAALLAAVGGRAPIVCELKSRFDSDMRLADHLAAVSADYAGPLAFKSFDPDVVARLRAQPPRAPDGSPRPLGMVAEARYDDPGWAFLSPGQKETCAAFLHYAETRPDFLSWRIRDLPHPTPHLLRTLAALPVMTWTVRSPEQRALSAKWADQIVFEGAGRP